MMEEKWDPDAIYDLAGIRNKVRWQFYFSWTFPDREFYSEWIRPQGERVAVPHEEASGTVVHYQFKSGEDRLLFFAKERSLAFRYYFGFLGTKLQGGMGSMYTIPQVGNNEVRQQLEANLKPGEILYATLQEGQIIFTPKLLSEVPIVQAREFTEEEMRVIDNMVVQKQIDAKLAELEELRSRLR